MNRAGRTVYPILLMVCATHLLNDMMQSVIPAVYPLLKEKFGFTFAQIGLITLVFQLTSSLLQPVAGRLADLHPRPYSLAAGMCFTLCGLLALAAAPGFALILVSVGLIGCGSSVFHPESSRVAQLASGGRKGLAQSIFQVGGNAGSAMGPLLAALIVIPFGQASIGWFALAALLAIFILVKIGNWYKRQLALAARRPAVAADTTGPGLSKRKIRNALIILGVLVFSKYFYIASMTNYFTFFLMDKFSMSVQGAQYALFAFLVEEEKLMRLYGETHGFRIVIHARVRIDYGADGGVERGGVGGYNAHVPAHYFNVYKLAAERAVFVQDKAFGADADVNFAVVNAVHAEHGFFADIYLAALDGAVENVYGRGAEELGNEQIVRIVINGLRLANLLHQSVLHDLRITGNRSQRGL